MLKSKHKTWLLLTFLFLTYLLFVVFGVKIFQNEDDELTQQSKDWLKLTHDYLNADSLSERILFGWDAEDSAGMKSRGFKRISEIRDHVTSRENENFKYSGFSLDPFTDTEPTKAFSSQKCDIYNEACQKQIIEDAERMREMPEPLSIEIEKYNHFSRSAGFKSSLYPSFSEPLPSLGKLATANWYKSLLVLHEVDTSGTQQAVLILKQDIDHLNRHFESSNNLIMTTIFLSLISKNIDVMSYLCASADGACSITKNSLLLDELTNKMISMEDEFARELWIMRDTLKAFYPETPSFPEGYAVKYLNKVNRSTNYLSGCLSKVNRLATAAMRASDKLKCSRGSSLDRLTNYFGYRMISAIDPASYSRYVARNHELNQKIKYFNSQLKNERAFTVDSEASHFCAEESSKTLKNLRCIFVF